MTYQEFKDQLQTNHKFDKVEYYQLIVQHKDEILLDIQKTTQQKVAQDLNMAQIKLSHILNILRVL